MTSEPLLRFCGVSVTHDGTRALDDVTVDVPNHGVTVIAGASGSGKSTLLRTAVRLESATAGSIQLAGADITALDPQALRRRLAFVFQRPTLFPGAVLDNLRLAAPTIGRERAGELLATVALDPDLLDRIADTLSGGEAQRVCLARALATEPEALLIDEPTAALDPPAAAQIEEQIIALARSGMPVAWVSHDPGHVERSADWLIVLEGGRLRFAGPPASSGVAP